MVEWNKSDVEDYLDWLENHAPKEDSKKADVIKEFHNNIEREDERDMILLTANEPRKTANSK